MFDWNCPLYGNRTENDQIKTYHSSTTGGGVCAVTAIPATTSRAASATGASYVLDTLGIDVNNTTRFNVGDWRNAVTSGSTRSRTM